MTQQLTKFLLQISMVGVCLLSLTSCANYSQFSTGKQLTKSNPQKLYNARYANAYLRWLEKQAQQGNAQAQYQLGALLTHSDVKKGQQIPYKPQAGTRWLVRAADQGNEDAIILLSEIKFDYKWLMLAAEKGNANAAYKLGTLYETGQKNVPYGDNAIDIPQNYKTALHWFEQAARQGDSAAQSQVSQLLHNA